MSSFGVFFAAVAAAKHRHASLTGYALCVLAGLVLGSSNLVAMYKGVLRVARLVERLSGGFRNCCIFAICVGLIAWVVVAEIIGDKVGLLLLHAIRE
jgi:hypothetical protein